MNKMAGFVWMRKFQRGKGQSALEHAVDLNFMIEKTN